MAWRAAKKMSSTVPAWKAELQRRRKEKERAHNEADKRMPWKNDFNEPVNVIIISAKDTDPDLLEEKSSSLQDEDVIFHGNSSDSTNGVLEEHVTSVKNNPFLRFDQLITSKQEGPSSPRPHFLRRGSGPLRSFDEGDAPEEVSNLKSRSKSVDNLHFKFQNHVEEEEPSNNVVKEKNQGKGIIASLRAKFGKPASVDEFMAIVRRPRTKSQTLYDVQKAEASNKKDLGVSKTKENHDPRTDEKENLNDAQSKVPITTSNLGTNNVEDASPLGRDVSSSLVHDKEGQKHPETVNKVTPQTNDSGAHSQRFVKKKTSGLTAAELINLSREGETVSDSVQNDLKRPSEESGGKQFPYTSSKPVDTNRKETDQVLVGEDETDFVGKILPSSNAKKQGEKSVKPTEKVNQETLETKLKPVPENGKVDIKRTVIDGKGSWNAEKSHEVAGSIEKPTVMPSRPASLAKKPEPEKASPVKRQSQKTDHGENKGIKTTVTAEVKESDSSQNHIQQSSNIKGTKKETSKINLLPETKNKESVKTVKPPSFGPSSTSTDKEGDVNTSPFAVKLRKVDKSNAPGVIIVKSSKMTSGNVKSPKRTVQTVLQQQVNGEIPVTNIDDVVLSDIETPPKKNVNIKRVDFEVIGHNSPSKFPSMLKKNKKDRSKLHLRFDESSIETFEYPSLEVARSQYIAEHGDDEPEEEIVKVIANGADDDEEEEDIDEETKKKTMNNNTSIFSEGLQNITKSDTTDLSAFLGRGPHKKEPALKPVTRPPSLSSVSTAPPPEPEVVATPLDNGDGFSMGNSSALLF